LADADRIGHGWQLIDDCILVDGAIERVGPIAQLVIDRGIPLEMCVSSNECLGVNPADHPILKMHRAGFNVSVNTDNRTLTAGPLSGEYALVESLGASADEIEGMKQNAEMARFS
jgi:adenosine deaminase